MTKGQRIPSKVPRRLKPGAKEWICQVLPANYQPFVRTPGEPLHVNGLGVKVLGDPVRRLTSLHAVNQPRSWSRRSIRGRSSAIKGPDSVVGIPQNEPSRRVALGAIGGFFRFDAQQAEISNTFWLSFPGRVSPAFSGRITVMFLHLRSGPPVGMW